MRDNLSVVKLGGSLADDELLEHWLAMLAQDGAGKVVVVPGGGPFADQVRAAQARWRFADPVAHAMALHAMDQYAHMMCGIEPRLALARDETTLKDGLNRGRAVVWQPSAQVLAQPDIEASWEVTSDSLSAWLARRMAARALILVKALPAARLALPLGDLARSGVVDAAFTRALAGADFCVSLVSKTAIETVRARLRYSSTM